MRVPRATRWLRLQGRLLEMRCCLVEVARRRHLVWLVSQLVRLEDRLRLRLRQQVQRSKRRIRGIVDTTMVVLRIRRRMVVAGALLCTTQRVWVRPQRQQEAHRVTLVRRLVGKHCEVVRVRWTQRRLQVLRQVLRW